MAVHAILHALRQITAPPGTVLWLYGEPGNASGDVYHPWQEQARLLRQSGCNVFSAIDEIVPEYDSVFVNCPSQREESEGLLALALKHSRGFVMAAAPNNAGGNRLRAMMEAYGMPVHELSKNHCRVVWTMNARDADKSVIGCNLEHLVQRSVSMEGRGWWSVPGVFGWNKIDPGSRLLMQHLPSDLSGKVADFGCGYGYLSAMMARDYPAIETIDAYDADARAVSCCRRNNEGKVNPVWQDIKSLEAKPVYDAVVMNPPFHIGKSEDMELGRIFILKAMRSLKPGGRMFMVANRHLGYEKTVPGLTILHAGEGYKIMTGQAS